MFPVTSRRVVSRQFVVAKKLISNPVLLARTVDQQARSFSLFSFLAGESDKNKKGDSQTQEERIIRQSVKEQPIDIEELINNKNMSVKEKVDQAIKVNPIVLFSKEWCPFCVKAKQALDMVVGEGKYTVFELESMDRKPMPGIEDPGAYQDYLKELVGTRSVPKGFLAQKFIGGGDDIVALQKNEQLQQMAINAGIIQKAKAAPSNERYFVNGKLVDSKSAGF